MSLRNAILRIGAVCINLLIFAINLPAQDYDMQTFADYDLTGTARYVGMAGAMTSVGGDESAVKDNPAALGVYRRSAVSLSLAWQLDKSKGTVDYSKQAWAVPSASLLFSFGSNDRYQGMVFNNIMISYQRLKSFGRNSLFEARNNRSMAQLVCDITNSNIYNADIVDNIGSTRLYEDENVGWLSALYAESGIIKYNPSTSKWALISEGQRNSQLNIIEAGGTDQYTFAWGANVSNRLYLGLAAHILSMHYEKTTHFSENLPNRYYTLSTSFSADGTGFLGAFGLIYHPVRQLRLGASILSPSIHSMRITNNASLGAISTLINSYTLNKYVMPLRSTFGVSYQLGQQALLSVEYDYAHRFADKQAPEANMTDVHMIKAGVEWCLWNRMYLRAGYAFEMSATNAKPLVLNPFETRTDADYMYDRRKHYATAGIGYRGRFINAELAYRFRLDKAKVMAYEYQDRAFELNSVTNAVVVSLSWHN